jgi:hypothetical protein
VQRVVAVFGRSIVLSPEGQAAIANAGFVPSR